MPASPTPIITAYYDAGTPLGEWQEALANLKDYARQPIRLVPAEDKEAVGAGVLLAWKPPLDLIARLVNLRGVMSLGQGVDHILSQQDFPSHLRLIRLVDPYMAAAMTEWVLLAVLKWHRDDGAYMAAASRQVWLRLPPKMATTTTIAVMGVGAIGGHVAEALAGLGFRVLGWSRSPKHLPTITCTTGEVGFQHCLNEADCLVSLLPLTPATKHIFNQSAFSRMKPGAYFINGGRGDSVDEAALLAAIDGGHLAGACLDVFATEPLPKQHPFWRNDKITIWPHVSAQTNPITAAAQVWAGIIAIARGEAADHEVDIGRGY
ncbi:MAG: glyoxylate/hydroxypyruvate reductase A [Proteobacteria bacterium]|nr:glyoxylate/hydroxypyruvate reductase A [Pseudomonadota bacterium]